MTVSQQASEAYLASLLGRHPELFACAGAIREVVAAICRAQRAGGKVLVCGNGGSASDSEHIVGELMKGFVLPRPLPEAEIARFAQAGIPADDPLVRRLQRGVAAIALTGHPALATAIGNDTDAAMVFAQQVYVLGRPGDVLIGLSTSGNSANVVNAVNVARALGLFTVGMTGGKPSQMEALCQVTIKAPSTDTYRIQEFHLPVYHTICLMVEDLLFAPRPDEI